MTAQILRTGPLCTVQDLGRRGGLREGLSPGGAMDRRALMWANRLLGNQPGLPALEVTLGGIAIRFDRECTVGIAGADAVVTVNGRQTDGWRTVTVGPDETLQVGRTLTGMRQYIALPGGLECETVFGSASVVLREGLSGSLGRPARRGDTIRWVGSSRPETNRPAPARVVPEVYRCAVGEVVSIPFFPSYEWGSFSEDDQKAVFAATWRIDPSSDRIATRLAGPPLRSGPRVLDSVPLVDGTVQVLADGTPLVFMRDRPTIGGYAKLGSVDPSSLDSLAQARPGVEVRFVPGDAAAARLEAANIRRFFGLT